jgi:membrane protein implicated in regulation of membrane protease activity
MEMITDFYAAHPFWTWMAFAAALLAIEVSTGSGYLLWASGSAAVIALLTPVLPGGFATELGLFAGMTVVTSLLGERFVPRGMASGPDINDNFGRLVGKHGIAVTAFERGRGRVSIDGKEWAAMVEAGDEPLLDQRVEVISAQGAVLRVRAV